MVTQFPNKAAAESAIANAIASGRADNGYSEVKFGGNGGRTVFLAHVSKNHTGWCL